MAREKGEWANSFLEKTAAASIGCFQTQTSHYKVPSAFHFAIAPKKREIKPKMGTALSASLQLKKDKAEQTSPQTAAKGAWIFAMLKMKPWESHNYPSP